MKALLKILLHPLLIYGVIFVLECIPIYKPKVYNQWPKEGDNFKTESTDSVFYYTKGVKYFYESKDCYFKFGNVPFSKRYEEGGIMTVTPEIANQITLRGAMCGQIKLDATTKKSYSFVEKFLNFDYFFMQFSALSHFLFYTLLSFAIAAFYRTNTKKYWISFLGCFLGGGLLEMVQFFFIEGRTASIEDQILNTIGAVIGLLLFSQIEKKTNWLNRFL